VSHQLISWPTTLGVDAVITPEERFRQIYLDTGAGGRGPQAIALATRVFGADRIVFGTDYAPQPSVRPVIENIQKSPISRKTDGRYSPIPRRGNAGPRRWAGR
jgi:predicted TIM-barrel fold metal-dependent hydrolase